MFRKLVSGLPFSPALVGTLGFYARRLKQEEASRRLGLLFTALALVVQSFAVFSPPESANATSANDMIYGGVTSLDQVVSAYDDPDKDFKKILSYNGITRDELAGASVGTINSQAYGTDSEAWLSWGRMAHFSNTEGEVAHVIDGTRVYSRPLWRFDTGNWSSTHGSTYNVYRGHSQKIGEFAIIKDSGNLVTRVLPSPLPTLPAPTAACSSLSTIKLADNRYKFTVMASTGGGANISNYTIVIKNAAGNTVKTIHQPSTAVTVTTGEYTFLPDSYSVAAAVNTSVGDKISSACLSNFTVSQPLVPTHAAITVDKKIDGIERKTVAVGQEFSYQIVVKNSGSVPLSSITLSDNVPRPISLLSTSAGTLSGSRWSHTIGSLAAGQSQQFTLTAKVTSYVPGPLKNSACAETAAITATNPDDCDDAVVELPTPVIQACEMATFHTVSIKQTDFDAAIYSKNLNDCKRIPVCNLLNNTLVTIKEADFDAAKYRKELDGCQNIQVCDLSSGQIMTLTRSSFDSNKHSPEVYDCQVTVMRTNTGTNLTQDADATKVLARAGDRLQFTLTAQNTGKVDAQVDFNNDITDVLEYARLNDNGGGALNKHKSTTDLSWGKITLKPGEKASRSFAVNMLDHIPSTARGTSNPSSYDCIISNTYGTTLNIDVHCDGPKVLEASILQLPTAGPGENMIFAAIIGSITTFFWARSRQLKAEVRLIRRDFNAGIL